VTAGPFKLGRIDKTAQTVTMVRDPNWWGQPAKLDAIITRALDLTATIPAFVSGEVDVADVGPDPSAFKRAKTAQGGAIREAAGPDFRHFTINATSTNLSDVNVRRAVAMAIDRQAIARADLTGLNWPARTLDNHFFVNTQAGYANNSGDVGKFNPDKAKQLLDGAGWKQSGAFRQKDGKTLSLRFVIPTGTAISKQEGELAQAMLKDVGVKLEIDAVPSNDFFDKYIIPGNFDIVPFSWIGTPYPISSGQSIYINIKKDAKGQIQTQQNFARVGSAQIDDLISKAEETLDVNAAHDLLNQADKLVWDEVHSLTLFQRPQITAVKATVANVGSFGFKSPVAADFGYVK
jgi:peptide/nickel transport system substrate-binding protein